MSEFNAIDLVKQRTAELVAQRLRSDSVVVLRLAALIDEACKLGHSHRSIHLAIQAGGLATSWNNYRVYLGRARRARRAQAPALGTAPSLELAGPPSLPATGGGAPGAAEPGPRPVDPPELDQEAELAGPRSATHVLDALRRAREVASKDYSRIAREHYRKDRK